MQPLTTERCPPERLIVEGRTDGVTEAVIIELGRDWRDMGKIRTMKVHSDISTWEKYMGMLRRKRESLVMTGKWPEANILENKMTEIRYRAKIDDFIRIRAGEKAEDTNKIANLIGDRIKMKQELEAEIEKLRHHNLDLQLEIRELTAKLDGKEQASQSKACADTLIDSDSDGETLNMMVQLAARKDEVQANPRIQDSVRLVMPDLEVQSSRSSDEPGFAEPEPVMAKKKRRVPGVAAPTGTRP